MQRKWLENTKEINEELNPFYHRRIKLFIENGCFMWVFKDITPKTLKLIY